MNHIACNKHCPLEGTYQAFLGALATLSTLLKFLKNWVFAILNWVFGEKTEFLGWKLSFLAILNWVLGQKLSFLPIFWNWVSKKSELSFSILHKKKPALGLCINNLAVVLVWLHIFLQPKLPQIPNFSCHWLSKMAIHNWCCLTQIFGLILVAYFFLKFD